MIVGEGAYRYEVTPGWEQRPVGWANRDVPGIAVDAQDRVYCFTRSEHPVIVYEGDGSFAGTWGAALYSRFLPHLITITPDERVFLAGDRDHTIREFTLDGTLVRTLGEAYVFSDTGYVPLAGQKAQVLRGAGPFNRPTQLVVAPNGDWYATDGYGNSRVHHFSPDGELLRSWGEPGNGPSEFALPHSLWISADGRVFVCDRENDRVQVFGPTGELLAIWSNCAMPSQMVGHADGVVYLLEVGHRTGSSTPFGVARAETIPARITVRDLDGAILATLLPDPDPNAPSGLPNPHGIAIDSRGDLYVGSIPFLDIYPPYRPNPRFDPGCATIQKFVRLR